MNDLLDRLFALERQQRYLVYGGFFVLVSLLYWYSVYAGAAATLAERREKLDTLQQEETQKIRLVSRLDQYRSEVKELDAQLRKAVAQLPDQKEIPDLLSTVSSLGRESGLEIVLFRQRPENYQDFYAEVPVEILMRGSYGRVTDFFAKVGGLNRIVNVTDISMKTPVISDGQVSIDTSCTAVTFRFISEEERARIAAERAKK